MNLWTIYDHPLDYPNSYVARRFLIAEGETGFQPVPTQDCEISTSLPLLRAKMASLGLVCLARSPEDDPNIVETWL